MSFIERRNGSSVKKSVIRFRGPRMKSQKIAVKIGGELFCDYWCTGNWTKFCFRKHWNNSAPGIPAPERNAAGQVKVPASCRKEGNLKIREEQ